MPEKGIISIRFVNDLLCYNYFKKKHVYVKSGISKK